MKTKILLIEQDLDAINEIQQELKIGLVNCIMESVQSEKEFEKAVRNFKPDLILSNYTSPNFDGLTALKIREKLVPQTPFIFISESIGEENAVALIKNGATDLVLKERLGTLADKVNRALQEVVTVNLQTKNKQSDEKSIVESDKEESKQDSLFDKKNLKKAISIEQQRFQDLFLQAPSCMGILKGPNHVYELANNLYLQLINKKKDIIGKTVKEVLPELEAQGIFEFLDTVYQTGETFSANEMLVKFDFHGNGKMVDTYLNFIYQAHRDSDGAIDGIFFFANDVTEQVLSRKELALQNEEKENRAAELNIANKELAFQNEEKENRVAELIIANKELAFQNSEKENRAAELIIANKELAFQNEEKENRAAELIIANKELAFQNSEKEERAAELIVANKELAFQNEEKENRAAELIIANKELAFQNEEKENRAAELIIANKEIAFQNEEKEERAAELIIANKELAFQNEEKEERAAELIIANQELGFQNDEKENRAVELIIANKELAFQNIVKENLAAELIITNNELIKTNTELDRFVYSVSHDLRSPLTSIIGLLSFIEEETQEPDTLEHAKMIHNSINRLDQFIKNIISYSRNNRTELEIEKISIQEITFAIVDSIQSMKGAKEILYEIDIKEEHPFYTDRLRLKTIMENLISNAIKHHKKDLSGSYIKITGQSDPEKLQLTVSDNGIGIESAYHHKIFDMFFRLSGETDGSGIGLYIVKDTVEKLKGSIKVESEKGIGTSFIITLKNLKP